MLLTGGWSSTPPPFPGYWEKPRGKYNWVIPAQRTRNLGYWLPSVSLGYCSHSNSPALGLGCLAGRNSHVGSCTMYSEGCVPREYGEGHNYNLLHLLLTKTIRRITYWTKFRATKLASQEIIDIIAIKVSSPCNRLKLRFFNWDKF